MILGEFDPSDPYPMPWVRVLVLLAGISSTWTEMRFLLDTGAGRTCLHPRDAIAVGVTTKALTTPADWSNIVHLRGVGGSMTYFETDASFAFEQTDGNLRLIDRKIHVAQAQRQNTRLPSLLGWDILRDFHLRIHEDSGLIELEPIVPNVVQVPGSP